MKIKCIVQGCSNHQGEGGFIGDICHPCYQIITTGIVGPTTSFLRLAKPFPLHAKQLAIWALQKQYIAWRDQMVCFCQEDCVRRAIRRARNMSTIQTAIQEITNVQTA